MNIYTDTHILRRYVADERLRSVTAESAWAIIEDLMRLPATEETWLALVDLIGAWPDSADVERWVDALEPKIEHWHWRLRRSTLGQRQTQGDKACVYRLIGCLEIGRLDDSTGQKFTRWATRTDWRKLRGLHLRDLDVDVDGLATFLASLDRRCVEALILRNVGRQTGAIPRLFANARLEALTELGLVSLDLRRADMLALGELPMSKGVRSLDVSGNFLYARDVDDMVDPARFPALETLTLGQTDLRGDEIERVLAGVVHPNLRRVAFPNTPAARALGQDVVQLPGGRS